MPVGISHEELAHAVDLVLRLAHDVRIAVAEFLIQCVGIIHPEIGVEAAIIVGELDGAPTRRIGARAPQPPCLAHKRLFLQGNPR